MNNGLIITKSQSYPCWRESGVYFKSSTEVPTCQVRFSDGIIFVILFKLLFFSNKGGQWLFIAI